jgi:glutaredoxin 3
MARAAKIVMYTTPWCGYCAAAKKLLGSKQAAYDNIDVGSDRTQLQNMIDLCGGRTVPQIFINDQAIGGYDDIAALDANGELDGLLDQAPPTD